LFQVGLAACPGISCGASQSCREKAGAEYWKRFLVSTGIVAIAEVGDKTQLLALVLAARYGRPLPIVLGILVATLANHALAAWLGVSIAASPAGT